MAFRFYRSPPNRCCGLVRDIFPKLSVRWLNLKIWHDFWLPAISLVGLQVPVPKITWTCWHLRPVPGSGKLSVRGSTWRINLRTSPLARRPSWWTQPCSAQACNSEKGWDLTAKGRFGWVWRQTSKTFGMSTGLANGYGYSHREEAQLR